MGQLVAMKTSISVIIPTFNRAAVLPRALDSVRAQTRRPEEVIVVDDGSTDGTAELVAERYPWVSYVHQANGGVSAARNTGIARARGEWIALLDSDDSWLPTKLQTQLEHLRIEPHLLCHTEELWVRNGRRVNQMKKHAKAGGAIYRACLPLCVISPSSVLLHRRLLAEVGTFDPELLACEDYDLWLRICARHPVLFVETPLITKYGGHSDQLSRSFVGIDRFRIRALEKMLHSTHLDRAQREATLEMMLQKIAIYSAGARKHGRAEEARSYEELAARWRVEGPAQCQA